MKKFYISIFFASLLLITSCADAPAPNSSPCSRGTVFVPEGREVIVNNPDGTTSSGTSPAGGMEVPIPCDGSLSQ